MLAQRKEPWASRHREGFALVSGRDPEDSRCLTGKKHVNADAVLATDRALEIMSVGATAVVKAVSLDYSKSVSPLEFAYLLRFSVFLNIFAPLLGRQWWPDLCDQLPSFRLCLSLFWFPQRVMK